jgi:hypothetical protein
MRWPRQGDATAPADRKPKPKCHMTSVGEDVPRVEFPWPTGTNWQDFKVHLPESEPISYLCVDRPRHAAQVEILSIPCEKRPGNNE